MGLPLVPYESKKTEVDSDYVTMSPDASAFHASGSGQLQANTYVAFPWEAHPNGGIYDGV